MGRVLRRAAADFDRRPAPQQPEPPRRPLRRRRAGAVIGPSGAAGAGARVGPLRLRLPRRPTTPIAASMTMRPIRRPGTPRACPRACPRHVPGHVDEHMQVEGRRTHRRRTTIRARSMRCSAAGPPGASIATTGSALPRDRGWAGLPPASLRCRWCAWHRPRAGSERRRLPRRSGSASARSGGASSRSIAIAKRAAPAFPIVERRSAGHRQ